METGPDGRPAPFIVNEVWSMGIFEQLTSLEGRINRLRYLGVSIILYILLIFYLVIILLLFTLIETMLIEIMAHSRLIVSLDYKNLKILMELFPGITTRGLSDLNLFPLT